MNGRIYAPQLGRMLSPDPVTQAPDNGQNYNRYTYALNNPLKYTDPTGYQVGKAVNCENCDGKGVMAELWTDVGPGGAWTGAGSAALIFGVGQSSIASMNQVMENNFRYSVVQTAIDSGSGIAVNQHGDLVNAQGEVVIAGGELGKKSSVTQDPVATGQSSGAEIASLSAGILESVGDGIGKIWNLPNTIVGVVIGMVGHTIGWAIGSNPYIVPGNNAIQFVNNPLSPLGAITLGNAIIYGGEATPGAQGLHERQHTIQGQWLGPFYIPLNVVGQTVSLLTLGKPGMDGPSPVHGTANFMEAGPLSDPPRAWPWGR